jgi:SAM-dependent methyltransferase
VSITIDFLGWARLVSKTTSKPFDFVAPLVPSAKTYTSIEESVADDWLDKNYIFNDGAIRAYFVGSLNSVFDFDPILFAAKKLNIEFIICGDGPLRETLENQFKGIPSVKFLGWVNQSQSDALARRSTFALAPMRDRADFNMSIPNKFYDAIRLGKPIVAPNFGIAAEFIKANRIGACYDPSDLNGLANSIETLLNDPKALLGMSSACESLFHTSFNPSNVYGDLVRQIEALSYEIPSPSINENSNFHKEFEIRKYDQFAMMEMAKGKEALELEQPLDGIIAIHTPPYLAYIKALNNHIRSGQQILELGAGTGKITASLVPLGAELTAIDISPESLSILKIRSRGKIKTVLGDIDELPFEDNSFDMVIASGSLSYGTPSKVDGEIFRILKDGGSIIILDSLNHNPIYKLNRYMSFIRGKRSRMSVESIPKLERIESLASNFQSSRIEYFGHFLWIYPFVRIFLPPRFSNQMMERCNQLTGPRKMSFKFLLIGEKLKK